MDNKILFALLLSLVLILIIVCVFYCYRTHTKELNFVNDSINGIWSGDTEFCNQAGLSLMYIYLYGDQYKKDGYIVMIGDDGQILTNQEFNILINNINYKNDMHSMSSRMTFNESDIFPENVILDLDMARGILRIKDNDTVYGLLYRNNELSLKN